MKEFARADTITLKIITLGCQASFNWILVWNEILEILAESLTLLSIDWLCKFNFCEI